MVSDNQRRGQENTTAGKEKTIFRAILKLGKCSIVLKNTQWLAVNSLELSSKNV